MAAPPDETPDGLTDGGSFAIEGDGSRRVTNYELKILSLTMMREIDKLAALIQGFQMFQAEYRPKIDANADEISRLRTHHHDGMNKLQAIELRTANVTPDLTREMIELLPSMRLGAEIMLKREVRDAFSPDEMAFFRHFKQLHEQEVEQANQVTIGKRISQFGMYFSVAIFIASIIISHFWR